MSTFDDLLSGKPARIQATARATRSFIRSLAPAIVEQIAGVEASYGRPQVFCAIAVERGEMLLRFPNGSPPDPHRLLRPAGTGQRAIRLRAPTDFSDAVRAMIRTAYQQAA